MFTPEQLLKPRFKVIALYPGIPYELNDIVELTPGQRLETSFADEKGKLMYYNSFAQFPHLFKELKWWQCREMSDLPLYVKTNIWGVGMNSVLPSGTPLRVIEWQKSTVSDGVFRCICEGVSGKLIPRVLHPITEHEYELLSKQLVGSL